MSEETSVCIETLDEEYFNQTRWYGIDINNGDNEA